MPDEKQTLVEWYLKEVIETNKVLNLTKIDSFDHGMILHVEDSLCGMQELEQSPDGKCVDIGSGGGFPAVPLAIYSQRPFLLVDSVAKKMKAVDQMAASLNLSSLVATYAGRVEELSIAQPSSYSVVTARALTALPSLVELAQPLLQNGGHLICYKSQAIDDEISRAESLSEKLGMKYVSRRDFMLSDAQTKRSIVVFEKTGEALVSLPRRNGMAQKRPYA